MFPRALSPCSSSKRRLFCQNQHIFIYCLPIDFFYFEDFRWSIFGKIIGQKRQILLQKMMQWKKAQIFYGRVIFVQQMKVNERCNAHKSFDVLDLLDLLGKQKNKYWFLSSLIYVIRKSRVYLTVFLIKSFELSLKYSIFALQHT